VPVRSKLSLFQEVARNVSRFELGLAQIIDLEVDSMKLRSQLFGIKKISRKLQSHSQVVTCTARF
jgi:hypothetical protein